jgi:hypothetical protein
MDLGFGNWPTIQALRNPTRPASTSTSRPASHKRPAGFQVPKSVRLVESMPKTGTGKILKHELRKQLREKRSPRCSRGRLPPDRLEALLSARLVAIWRGPLWGAPRPVWRRDAPRDRSFAELAVVGRSWAGGWLERSRRAPPSRRRFGLATRLMQNSPSGRRARAPARAADSPRTPHTVLLALFWDIHLVFGLAIDVALIAVAVTRPHWAEQSIGEGGWRFDCAVRSRGKDTQHVRQGYVLSWPAPPAWRGESVRNTASPRPVAGSTPRTPHPGNRLPAGRQRCVSRDAGTALFTDLLTVHEYVTSSIARWFAADSQDSAQSALRIKTAQARWTPHP